MLDISSDEEGWGETQGSYGVGSEDYNWISELLDDKVGDREIDDSDDVVFVGEVMLSPKLRSKSSSVAENDLDDDCVVLDGDPYNSGEIENSNVSDLDDLLTRMIGEIPRGTKEIWASDVAAPRMEGTRFITDNIRCSAMVAVGGPATMVAWFSFGNNDGGRSNGGGVLVEKLGVVLRDNSVWGARNRRRESLETRWRLKT
ncbi:hypothetical protein U1Q18_018274 [Sarracenia purpurea var. burkii]